MGKDNDFNMLDEKLEVRGGRRSSCGELPGHANIE